MVRLPPPRFLTFNCPRNRCRFPNRCRPANASPGSSSAASKAGSGRQRSTLEEIPVLASYKMNFLTNCYGSLFVAGKPRASRNEWWKPIPEPTKEAFAKVFRAARDNGITFCFAVHPQLHSLRPLNLESAEDLDSYYQHFAWAQSQGVHWFSVSLDDVNWGTRGPAAGGAEHARFVNTIFDRLRRQDPTIQLIFCPVPYWGDGTQPDHRAYLQALGSDLHPDVDVFWTGDGETTPHITRRAAESYKGIVKHRLFLWDNYPVNDGYPTLHLGPVSGRAPSTCARS